MPGRLSAGSFGGLLLAPLGERGLGVRVITFIIKATGCKENWLGYPACTEAGPLRSTFAIEVKGRKSVHYRRLAMQPLSLRLRVKSLRLRVKGLEFRAERSGA